MDKVKRSDGIIVTEATRSALDAILWYLRLWDISNLKHLSYAQVEDKGRSWHGSSGVRTRKGIIGECSDLLVTDVPQNPVQYVRRRQSRQNKLLKSLHYELIEIQSFASRC